jgi:hypothetical protein
MSEKLSGEQILAANMAALDAGKDIPYPDVDSTVEAETKAVAEKDDLDDDLDDV